MNLDNKKLLKLYKKLKKDYNRLTQDFRFRETTDTSSECYRENKKEAETTARTVKETILAQGKLDIERLTNNGKSSIEKAELQIKTNSATYYRSCYAKSFNSTTRLHDA